MSKYILLAILTGYQLFLSPLLKQLLGTARICRHSVSCSEYAKQVIKEHGAGKGGLMSLKKLFACQPWIKPYAYI